MSGHLLQTMNPEAVADHEVPQVGTWVLFFARPGMGMGGKTTFAALCTHADKRTGGCELVVKFAAEDEKTYQHVRRRSDQEPLHCWDFPPDYFAIGDVQERLDGAHDNINALTKAVFGDWNQPTNADGTPKSIIDILAEFEQRVFAAEKKKPAA